MATQSDRLEVGDMLEVTTASANIPTLLMVLYQVTGDERWLEPRYRPTRTKGLGDHDSGGLPVEVQTEIREAAVEALRHLLEGKPPAIEFPTPAETSAMLSVCVGEPVDESYGEMFAREYRRRIEGDAPSPGTPVDVPDGFHVLVIGAGVSGIIAAQSLSSMGVDYTVVDQHDEPGGNWLDNRYPGAGVDTPSHLYSFSFAPHDWSNHFELRQQLEEYFIETFDRIGAREHARLGTEVVRAEYDEATGTWTATLRSTADGTVETLTFNAIIGAVGLLNRPKLPDLTHVGEFPGPSFHSSCWPDDLDVTGKRVAIIGSGASAMQIAPAIADKVEGLLLFQRTPQWIAPFEKFMQPIDADARELLRHVPIYRTWYWLKLYWQFGDKVLDSLRMDPDWPHPERAVNARNDAHRVYFTDYIRDELGDRHDLFAKALPTYPPYGKRILLDNGWYRTLRRGNVTLIDQAVTAVTDTGVATESGEKHEADVLVWATGFQATRFVSSLDLIGKGGISLRDAWDDDDARAYLGVSVPDFPNLFLLGGPNSFPGSGSFMYFMEVQMRYIARLLAGMFETDARVIEVRREVYEEYTDLVDSTSEQTVWAHPGTNTYFRNSRGRVLFVSPFRNVEYWTRAERSGLADYDDVTGVTIDAGQAEPT